METEIAEFFEEVLRRIEQHPRYSVLLRNAVAAQEQLILNYHNHAAGQPYCVALGFWDGVAALGLRGEFRELAHIKGIAAVEEACEPLMCAFAELLERRFSLRHRPQIYLQGEPFQSS